MVTVYGIKNCDTVKKARKLLDERAVDYRFHDVREDGLDKQALADWIEELGWENILNRRSTSWKALDQKTRDNMNAQSALNAVLTQPTLIKRPLLDTGKARYTGFSNASYENIFSANNF